MQLISVILATRKRSSLLLFEIKNGSDRDLEVQLAKTLLRIPDELPPLAGGKKEESYNVLEAGSARWETVKTEMGQ